MRNMRALFVAPLILATGLVTARGAAAPPPGCSPVSLGQASGAGVCVDGLLVTASSGGTFEVTDHVVTRAAAVDGWWDLGTPAAGQVVTVWGDIGADGTITVTRWIERTHGTGSAPGGPYRRARLVDVAAGREPENRMVWVLGQTFLNYPQYDGDGDVHIQIMSPCPAAGLTTESTPQMRGYVDRPARDAGLSGTPLGGSLTEDAVFDPPLGVPVMILGAARYDYDYGWWELHPIRAWHVATPEELAAAAGDCGGDPVPRLDTLSNGWPAPYGVPACGHLPVGDLPVPGFKECVPICRITQTALGQPEKLEGPCTGIAPETSSSQEGLPYW